MDRIREIGKYIVIVTCIIAVAHGLIYRTFFAPLEISIACVAGIILWVVGYLGVKIPKYLKSRKTQRSR
jgi:uncharacterized membrane protein (DUF373 family)